MGQRKTVLIDVTLCITGFIVFSVADSIWMMFVFLIPYCMGGIASSTLQGVISNTVSDSHQGEIQGTVASVMSLF